jgi:RNA polymerase primary sigma factor
VPQEADDLSAYFADVTRIDLLSPEREKSLAAELVAAETAAWRTALAHDDVAREVPHIINPLLEAPIRTARATEMRKVDPDRTCIETLARELARERGRAQPLWWHKSRSKAGEQLVTNLRQHNAAAASARHEFVTANLRLVIAMAKKYRTGGSIALSDLIQEGNIGLVHAVGRFEPERGLRFSTFACWWIRHFIGRCIENTASTVRIPVHMRQTMRSIESARTRLASTLGRAPTTLELATAADLTEKEVARMAQFLVGSASSLDEPVIAGEEEGAMRIDVLVSDGRAPDDHVHAMRMGEQIHRHLKRLKPMEAEIIRNRFGFTSREDTFDAIGQRYSLTRERIRQVQEIALGKLRRYMEHDRLAAEARRFAADAEIAVPAARVDLETPASPGESFRLDIRIGARVAVITWRDDRRFSVADHSPYADAPPADAFSTTIALALAQRALAPA